MNFRRSRVHATYGRHFDPALSVSVPVSHGSAVVARDEAVWPGVAGQDVGDAELGHVAVVGTAEGGSVELQIAL